MSEKNDMVLIRGYDLRKKKIVAEREYPVDFAHCIANINVPGRDDAHFRIMEVSKEIFDKIEFAYIIYQRGKNDRQRKTVDPWHYPSKGDYPPDEKQVLCFLWDDDYDVGYFVEREEAWHFEDYGIFDKDGDVKAWQYIEPPKENA